MKHGAFAKAILFLLSLFFVHFSFAQEIIPLTILNSGHIVFTAKVNGVEGKFIFDTGGGITILTNKFSSKLHDITKQDGVLTGFRATGERLNLNLYKINELSIGKFVDKNPIVSIIDVNLPGCDGIISLMPFQNQPFTLDLKNKILVLETHQSITKRKAAGETIKLYPDQNRGLSLTVFADFVLNNKKTLQFLLDSGAGKNSFWINSRYLSACGIDISDTANVKKIIRKSEFNKDAETIFYKASVPELNIYGYPQIKKENFNATFTEALIYDGKISINWLGDAVTFDLKNRKMIVQK